MSASDHLSQQQFAVGPPLTGREVQQQVRGSGTGRGYAARQQYRFHPEYPIEHLPADAEAVSGFTSPRHVALRQQVESGTVDPIVVVHTRSEPVLRDGYHRVATARAAGKTHLPAYVQHW